jgi:predicted Rdx family selenoprotein
MPLSTHCAVYRACLLLQELLDDVEAFVDTAALIPGTGVIDTLSLTDVGALVTRVDNVEDGLPSEVATGITEVDCATVSMASWNISFCAPSAHPHF